MFNVLNTNSAGGLRCGRHWQSSNAEDLGLHGDIVGYHNTDLIPSSYQSYVSYNAFKQVQVSSAKFWDGTQYIDNIGVTLLPAVFDTIRKQFYTDYIIKFPLSVDPAYPSQIISTSEYCKIKFRVCTFLQRQAYYDTSPDYHVLRPYYYQYDDVKNTFYNGVQAVELWNYHTFADLENDNYYEYYNEVGVNYWETLPEHRSIPMDIALATLQQGISHRLYYFSEPWGGTFSIRNDLLNINMGYNYGIQSAGQTSAGYVKFKNATVYNYRISPSYAVIPDDPANYTYMDIYDATIYGKGHYRASPTVEYTLQDTPNVLVIPNTTRDFVY